MALDIYFPENVANGIASGLALLIETATASGNPNCEFVRGAVAMARAQALQYGLSWPDVLASVRATTGGEYALLAPGHTGGLVEGRDL